MKKSLALPPKNPINDEVLTHILYSLWSDLYFGQEFQREGRMYRIVRLETHRNGPGIITFLGQTGSPLGNFIPPFKVDTTNPDKFPWLRVVLSWRHLTRVGGVSPHQYYQVMSVTDLMRFMRGSSAANEKPFSDWWKGENLVYKLIHRYRQYLESFIGKPEDMALVREKYAKELSAPAAVSRNLILF